MSSIKVVLYRSKVLKNGEHPIMLRVIKDRKTKYISIGESCAADLWDEKKNLPKKKHPLYHELVVLIDTRKVYANRLMLDLTNDNTEFSSEEVSNVLKSSKTVKENVLQYFNTVIASLKLQGRVGTAAIFKSTHNSLSTYREGKDFDFSMITVPFLTRWYESLQTRGVKLTTISVYMRTFQRLISLARENKVVKKDFDPTREFGLAKYKNIKTRKRAIPKDQMLSVGTYEVEEGSRMFHSKNYFMFSYYNRGMNFIDMAQMKWENIRNQRLDYVRKKTKKNFTMALLEPALVILAYYR